MLGVCWLPSAAARDAASLAANGVMRTVRMSAAADDAAPLPDGRGVGCRSVVTLEKGGAVGVPARREPDALHGSRGDEQVPAHAPSC